MRTTPLKIANVNIVINRADNDNLILPPSMSLYINKSAAENPDIVIDWKETDYLPPYETTEFIYNYESVFNIFLDKHINKYIANYSGEEGYFPKYRMIASTDWKEITVFEDPSGYDFEKRFYFRACHIVFCARFPFHNGIVFHSSGIDDNGQGLIFTAHSGVGKSTQALMWSKEPGVTMINHDRMALSVCDGIVNAHGIPWGGSGDITLNHKMPLKAIILLEQASENRIEKLSALEAIPELMARSYLPYWSNTEMDHAIGVIENILSLAPVYRLHCRPEQSVIPLVRSVIYK